MALLGKLNFIEIADGTLQIEDYEAQAEIVNLKENIANIEKYIYNLNGGRVLYVSKIEGSLFNTINSAIDYAKDTLNVSNSNKVTILIDVGVYDEQIVLDDVHGLSFYGVDKNNCIIQFNGTYPDCVLHLQGDYYFCNLTLKGLNPDVYIVHQDPSNSNVEGTLFFENCIFESGRNGIGYGSGKNTTLRLKDCYFNGQADYCIYAHNSPYARTNQKMIMENCIFSKKQVLSLDDAGYTYGQGSSSPMELYFKGNMALIADFGSVIFKLDQNHPENATPYIYGNNFKLSVASQGNFNIPSLNTNYCQDNGRAVYNMYMTVPQEDQGGGCRWYVPLMCYVLARNIKINSVTLPGVGDKTSAFAVSSKNDFGAIFYCNDTSLVGKQVIVNFSVEMGG